MGRFFERYAKFLGLIMLTAVITLLLSTPSMILAKSITSIGTELSYATGDELMVRTKIDFGSNEHMQALTRRIGNWTGSDYESGERYKELLGADVLLLRHYAQPGKIQPIDLLLMQSNNRTSFHPPIVCYPALGYTIEAEGKELITLQNVSWAADRWMERRDLFVAPTVAVKKLVVVKESETGAIEERQVVLYFYVKEQPFTSDTITMVRISALAPLTEPYDEITELEKGFLAGTFPYLFEVRETDEPRVVTLLAYGTLLTKLALLLLVLAPVAVIFYPQLKAATRHRTANERQE
jgi:hypothetical protein